MLREAAGLERAGGRACPGHNGGQVQHDAGLVAFQHLCKLVVLEHLRAGGRMSGCAASPWYLHCLRCPQ